MYIQKFLYTPFTPTQTYTPTRGTGGNVKNLRNLRDLRGPLILGRTEICVNP